MEQHRTRGTTKKVISLILDEADVIELHRILTDNDAIGALAFLNAHLRGKTLEVLEGG